jgi:SAM-dependent methyltransferase
MKNNAKKIIKDLSVKSFAGKFMRRCVHALKYGHSRLFKEEPNIKMFDTGEFYLKDSGKREAYLEERIYMDDEGAAVCYAFGVDYISHAGNLRGNNFKEVVKHIMSLKKRSPELVINIGCGLGMIDAALTYANVRCIGIDPSPGSVEGYRETFRRWLNTSEYHFLNQKAHEAMDIIMKDYGPPDTVIMCEAIEHIPKHEFDSLWGKIVPILRKKNGIFIITNGLSENHFPVIVDGTGWCHIREINDRTYDSLAGHAKETLFRHKAHLVLQF